MHDGHATGEYEDFLTGFVTPDGKVWAARSVWPWPMMAPSSSPMTVHVPSGM